MQKISNHSRTIILIAVSAFFGFSVIYAAARTYQAVRSSKAGENPPVFSRRNNNEPPVATGSNSTFVPLQTGGGYELKQHLIASGGERSTGGSFAITTTIGQPTADYSTGGQYGLRGGFWAGARTNCPAIAISPATLPNSQLGAAYNQPVEASGGIAPYSFAHGAGALPSTLTLSSSGLLSGTALQVGTFNFTVRATDANGCIGEHPYSVIINPCPTLTISPDTLPNATVNLGYSQTLNVTGGAAPYSFSLGAGALPNGLILNASGLLSGAATASGTFIFSVQATDANGCLASRSHSLLVNPSPSGTAFNPAANFMEVRTLQRQPDAKLLAGGASRQLPCVDGSAPIIRYHPDGLLDTNFYDWTWVSALQGQRRMMVGNVTTSALFPNGQIVVAGTLELKNLDPPAPQFPNPRLIRLNTDGTFDPGFNVEVNDVLALVAQTDGKLIIGGSFTGLGPGFTERNRLARLNSNGTIDGAFNPNANGFVSALALQSDGKILVGGEFTSIAGQTRNYLVRLNVNGSLDNSFNPNLGSGDIRAILALPDGKVLLGGNFQSVDGQMRQGLARLNANGSLDPSFTQNTAAVNHLVQQTDGKILVAGDFTTLGGQPRYRFARLNADGSLDLDFFVHLNGHAKSSVLESDGRLIVGGGFTAVSGQARNQLARLNSNGALAECPALLSPASQSFIHQGGTGSIAVTVNCPWTAISETNWLTITSGASGNGDGTVNFSVAANPGAARTGWLTIAGRLFTVNQSSGCAFTINPTNQSFAAGGGNGGVAVNASDSACTWAASSNAGWITITGGASGSGNGSAGFTVTANTGPQRSGTMTIAGQTFTVIQDAGCAFTINPVLQNFAASGGSGSTNVTAAAGCAWTAQSNAAWITLTVFSGTGNGVVGYVVAANAGPQRIGTATIAGQTFTVTQDAFVCGVLTVNPPSLSMGFTGASYSQTITASGGVSPYSFTITAGALPSGLNLSPGGSLSGTPVTTGTFNFTVTATGANNCTGARAYSITISGNGLQFYPLQQPVRLLETRAGFGGCTNPGLPISANATFPLPAQTVCSGIPTNAAAVTGNITVVPSGPGYLTLFPSTAAQPTVANSNFAAGEITNNVFSVGLGAGDGAFNIFSSAVTEVIVDVTGYYAPPAAGGLYFHPLPSPVRLLETRPGQNGCIAPGAPLTGMGNPNADPNLDLAVPGRSPLAPPCNSIPASAQVLVGNATSVLPSGGGYLTVYPSGGTRPTVASSNYAGSDVINGPFAVKLGADGKFKIYTYATTHLVVDILGYYSEDAMDVSGAGLLFNPLPNPVRLLETRPDFPGFPLTGCTRTNAPIPGNLASPAHTQQARNFCGLPAPAQAVVGNVSVVNSAGAGFLTLFPGNLTTAPLVATSNYPAPATFGYNRHYFVGLSPADGTFKVLTQFTTDLILDASGYFAP